MMRFDVDIRGQRSGAQRSGDEPMRILIVGDLMGAGAGEARPLDQRPIVRVDAETFDDVFARFKPSVALPALGLPEPLAFESLEDFHPDELFTKVHVFDRLRTLRRQLQNPSTYAAAVDELKSVAPVQASPPPTDVEPVPTDTTTEHKTDPFLDQLLAGGASQASAPGRSAGIRAAAGVDGFIRSLVAPHIVAVEDPQLPQYLSAIDAAVADSMRSLLHDAAFQRLEATWRGVYWLLSGIDEEDLEFSLLHLTHEELRAEAGPDGALDRRLQPRGADEPPWSVIVADVAFGPSVADMDTLRSLARVVSGLGSPLVAAAEGSLVGCANVRTHGESNTWTDLPDDVARPWAGVREAPEGRSLGLAWPRILLRLPYGKKADPIDAFEFEEIPTEHSHEDYLWGNGAFAAALMMVRMHLGTSGETDGDIVDLPAFTYTEDGEPTMKPCAEFCMTQRTATDLLVRGIMPLASYANRNAVRLVRLQSIGATAIG